MDSGPFSVVLQRGRWEPAAAAASQLDLLARAHERVLGCQTRCIQQLPSDLRDMMPCVEHRLADLKSAWVMRLLQAAPTPWHLARLTSRRFDTLLKGARSRSKVKVGLQQAIERTQVPWFDKDLTLPETLPSCMPGTRSLLSQLQLHNKELAYLEQRNGVMLANDDNAKQIMQIQGVGPKLATAILRVGAAFRSSVVS